MLPKDQEKLINNVHSSVIEYLNDIDIKPNKTGKEIRSEIDLSIGNSSDLNQIKVLFDKYLEHSTKTYVYLFSIIFWNWVVPVRAPPWIASGHSFYC